MCRCGSTKARSKRKLVSQSPCIYSATMTKPTSVASSRQNFIGRGFRRTKGGTALNAIFQMAEVAVPRDLFRRILANIADLRCRTPTPC